jgi:protein TonB
MIARVSTWFEDDDPNAIRRWAIAAAIVVVIHVVVLCPYIYFYHPEDIGDDATPISIDLSPSDDTVDQTEIMPTPDQPPPPQEVVQPPPPPPPPQPSPVVIEAPQPPPPPPPQVVEEQQPQRARTKGGAPHVAPTWATALSRRLEQVKRYPNKARDHDEVGVVHLSFTVDRTGHVLSHQIAQTSGYPELDAEASAMIERAQPLPPFTDSMPEPQLDFTIPIRFSLEH